MTPERDRTTSLESLLFRIRDRVATDAEIERARAMIRADVRLPEELREVVDLSDDPVGDAVGLLAVLGADSLFGEVLREGLAAEMEADAELVVTAEMVDGEWAWGPALADAVRAEAGELEIADAVVEAVGGPARFPLAAAVRAEAGEVELASSVLAAVGLAERALDLAGAIASDAGSVEVADAVFASLGLPVRPPVAEAVREEAGSVELWASLEPVVSDVWVSAMLDHELEPAAHRAAVRRLQESPEAGQLMTAFASLGGDLRTAIRTEAGDCPYVWEAVARSIGIEPEAVPGWDGALVAEAVRAEAGPVDVTAAVMKQVEGRARLPYAAVELRELPSMEAANDRASGRWSSGAVLMALAAAFLLMALPGTWKQVAPVDGPRTAVVAPVAPIAAQQFASADEIVVEALDYGDLANVTLATGDEGALILWVDEGATL